MVPIPFGAVTLLECFECVQLAVRIAERCVLTRLQQSAERRAYPFRLLLRLHTTAATQAMRLGLTRTMSKSPTIPVHDPNRADVSPPPNDTPENQLDKQDQVAGGLFSDQATEPTSSRDRVNAATRADPGSARGRGGGFVVENSHGVGWEGESVRPRRFVRVGRLQRWRRVCGAGGRGAFRALSLAAAA